MTQWVNAALNFPPDQWEPLSRGLSAYTIEPYKNVFHFFVPLFWIWFTNCQEPRHIGLQDQAIQELKQAARIGRDVIVYTASAYHPAHCGGTISITRPAIVVPRERMNPIDDSTLFLVARELAQIKQNSSLIRLVVKVSFAVLLYATFVSAILVSQAVILAFFLIGVHILIEHRLQVKADLGAIEILGSRFPNNAVQIPNNAVQIALRALREIQDINIARRSNLFVRLYITSQGENILTSQYVNRRIQNLENRIH